MRPSERCSRRKVDEESRQRRRASLQSFPLARGDLRPKVRWIAPSAARPLQEHFSEVRRNASRFVRFLLEDLGGWLHSNCPIRN
jgi:hypothetical protein